MVVTNKWQIDLSEKEVKFTYKGEEVLIRVRPLTWSKKNQILSSSLLYDKEGAGRFDLDYYYKEALTFMITFAPWGKTDRTFLTTIDPDLGSILEKIVPKPMGEVEDSSFLEEESGQSSAEES